MLERIVIAMAFAAAGTALYRLIIALQLRRAGAVLSSLNGYQPEKFLILYFTSPTCAPCRTMQRPALQTVQTKFGDQLQIVTVDVMEHPAVAERWGVMTLPTTFLFDRQGKPGECNLGVANANKLIKQLTGMGARMASLPANLLYHEFTSSPSDRSYKHGRE